jgi:hypothetical protein
MLRYIMGWLKYMSSEEAIWCDVSFFFWVWGSPNRVMIVLIVSNSFRTVKYLELYDLAKELPCSVLEWPVLWMYKV